MKLSSQYDVLDVSDVLAPGAVPTRQLGSVVAFKIINTKWYNDSSKADSLRLERLVQNIEYSRTKEQFEQSWEDFKEWADDHYVWINEV